MTHFDRRRFNQLLLMSALAPLAAAGAPTAPGVKAASRKTYERAIVVDGCGGPGGFDPNTKPSDALLPWMVADAKSSGITAVNVTVGAVGNSPTTFEETVTGIAWLEREIALHPDVFMKLVRPAQLREAKASGKVGLILGFQDGSMFEANIDRVEIFHALGVRIVQPTYNRRNLIGDGCLEPADAGLSVFGREVVERINSLGILLDLSHCGQRTAREAIELTKVPFAFTHSGCRALVDVPRNRTDAELRAVADKGGMFGVYFMPFLRASGQPTSEDVIRHLEHAIKVCGEDHVGIGTDGGISGIELNDAYRKMHKQFVDDRRKYGIAAPGEDENVFNLVPDLNSPRRLETLADMLLARGHSESRVEKILGGNFARVLNDVWK